MSRQSVSQRSSSWPPLPPLARPPPASSVAAVGTSGDRQRVQRGGRGRGNVGGAVGGDVSGGGGGEGGDGVGRMDAAVAVTLLLSLPLRSPAGSRRERY